MSIKNKIAKATLVITGFAILGKILGIAREIIIAAIFGTTYKTDAYFIGITVPDFIREIVSGGVLTAVFIPVYSAHLANNNEKNSKQFLNTVSTLLIIALGISIVIGFPLAPVLVKIIAPELDESTFNLSVHITRIIFPSIIFMGLNAFYGSLLNIYKRFAAPSLSQVMLNLGVIGGVVILGRQYGVGSLAIGFLAGAVFQFTIILSALKQNHITYKPELIWSPEVKKMFGLWVPLFFASFAGAANDLVSRSLAAGLEPGNVAAINFANRIRETIWLLCAVPLGTAVFPFLSDSAANGQKNEMGNITSFAIRLTTFMALPLSLIMLVYSKPIIKLLFERGLFNEHSTLITSSALSFYSIGAIFYALTYVILRVYYSSHNAILPLKVFCFAFLINLFTGMLLRKYLSVGGIALARSLSDIFAFTYLLLSIKRISVDVDFKNLSINVLKICLVSLLSVGISYLIYEIMPQDKTNMELVFRLGGAVSSGIICYIGIGLMFKVQEINSIWNVVKQKLSVR